MVRNAWGTLRKVVLCPPTYFSLQPMNVTAQHYLDQGEKGDLAIAVREHAEFTQAYRESGIKVVMLEPQLVPPVVASLVTSLPESEHFSNWLKRVARGGAQ